MFIKIKGLKEYYYGYSFTYIKMVFYLNTLKLYKFHINLKYRLRKCKY